MALVKIKEKYQVTLQLPCDKRPVWKWETS